MCIIVTKVQYVQTGVRPAFSLSLILIISMTQVVRNLLASFDVVNLTDDQGNTALHIASYRGHLAVVEILILASRSLALLTNHYGDTFLHMAVAGFRSPGFRRLDKHTELMRQLVSGKTVNLQDIINVKNNDGRSYM